MGSRDRGGKGKREMKRTERCGERTERFAKKKRGIGDAKRGASRMKGKGQEARERKKGDEKG